MVHFKHTIFLVSDFALFLLMLCLFPMLARFTRSWVGFVDDASDFMPDTCRTIVLCEDLSTIRFPFASLPNSYFTDSIDPLMHFWCNSAMVLAARLELPYLAHTCPLLCLSVRSNSNGVEVTARSVLTLSSVSVRGIPLMYTVSLASKLFSRAGRSRSDTDSWSGCCMFHRVTVLESK